MAWAWEYFRRYQSIRVNDTYWGIKFGVKKEREKRKTAGEEILRQRLTCSCEIHFLSKAKYEKPAHGLDSNKLKGFLQWKDQ